MNPAAVSEPGDRLKTLPTWRAWIYALVGIVLLVAAVWTGFLFPWASEHAFLEGREDWKNRPVLERPEDEKWIQVLLELLKQDREEIRFWQAHLFTVSLGFDAVILGIVALALRARRFTDMHRCVFIAGCIFLCASYLFFLRFVDGAIAVNDQDLRGIQFALRLSESGRYLDGQQIYGDGPSPGQSHIQKLALFNIALALSSVAVIAFWRVRLQRFVTKTSAPPVSESQLPA